MFSLYLIRHGESINDLLTPMGVEQVRLACERYKRAWDGAKTEIFHSPTGRTKASATVVAKNLGLPSTESDLLSIAHFHNSEKHRTFADMIANSRARNIVLIGHDETTRWCDTVIFRCFRKLNKMGPPEVPLGGLLRWSEQGGYELL